MLQFLKRNWFDWLVSLFICALVVLGVMGIRRLGWLQGVELLAYDEMVSRRPALASGENPIVIIGLEESDVKELTRIGHYPLWDDDFVRIFEKLEAGRPSAIGMDIFRDFPIGAATQPAEKSLEKYWQGHPNIVGIMELGNPLTRVNPPAYLDHPISPQIGINDWAADPSGTVRRAFLYLDDPQDVYYPFALRLANLHLEKSWKLPPDKSDPAHIQYWTPRIPEFDNDAGAYFPPLEGPLKAWSPLKDCGGGYQYLIDFGGGRTYPTYTYQQLMNGEVAPNAFKGKICLIGLTTKTSMKDFVGTPIDGERSGVLVHADCIDQLLRIAGGQSEVTQPWPREQEYAWIAGWGLLGGLIGFSMRSPFKFILSIGAALGSLLITSNRLFIYYGWWTPLIPGAFACLGCAGLVMSYILYREWTQRTLLKDLFGRSVSRDVAAALWSQRRQILARGKVRTQRLMATALFTDLASFTHYSEKLDADQVMNWLSGYMEMLFALVEKHGGFVNKCTGDGLMAVFGVPLPHSPQKDAQNAVRCALAMREGFARMLDQRGSTAPLAMRIGIYTGELVAGSVGDRRRMEYTVIGDTVNTASRLESYDKKLMDPDIAAGGCRILVGAATRELLEGKFPERLIGEAILTGKDQRVAIYGIL